MAKLTGTLNYYKSNHLSVGTIFFSYNSITLNFIDIFPVPSIQFVMFLLPPRKLTCKIFWTAQSTNNYQYISNIRSVNLSFCLSFYLPTYLPTYLIYLSISPMLGLGRLSVSWSFYTVGRTPWMGDQPFARPLLAHRTEQTQNKHRQTCMSQVGFGRTISSERKQFLP
jgi:hypothetical protein